MSKEIRKLSAMPYAQAHIEKDDDESITLVSYVTPVATIDAFGYLTVNGLYSRTTIRHISAFLREYAPLISYAVAKQACLEKFSIHIENGDILIHA